MLLRAVFLLVWIKDLFRAVSQEIIRDVEPLHGEAQGQWESFQDGSKFMTDSSFRSPVLSSVPPSPLPYFGGWISPWTFPLVSAHSLIIMNMFHYKWGVSPTSSLPFQHLLALGILCCLPTTFLMPFLCPPGTSSHSSTLLTSMAISLPCLPLRHF